MAQRFTDPDASALLPQRTDVTHTPLRPNQREIEAMPFCKSYFEPYEKVFEPYEKVLLVRTNT